MSDAPAVPGRPALPRASTRTAYATLVRWQLAQIGTTLLPLVIVVQALMAAGLIVGFGFVIPDIDGPTALHLSTGTPTILLLTVALVIVPQSVATARVNGTFAYQRALPVARPLVLLADLTVWSAIALPSIAVAVGVARLRFGLTFAFDWPLLVASALLVTVTATVVGYMIAVSLPPMLAQLITQVLVFFVLLFSPISFRASQLPSWFQTLHDWLPIRPAADLVRAGLASGTYTASGRDLLVLLAWALVAAAASVRALVARG